MKMLRHILPFLLVATLPVQAAVNRAISIQAPTEAVAGSTVSVTVQARTNASDGEQIGSIEVEYSIDEGKTWAQLYQAKKSGAELSHQLSFAVNTNGGRALVRGRVAFSGGVAGDVDYKGDAIQWRDNWQKWRWPPAKYVIIQVPSPPPVTALPARPAVNRKMSIQAPVEAVAGSTISVAIHLSTDANDGEHICFPHVAYSIDGGKTWTRLFYEETAGVELSQEVSLVANPKGGKTLVRIRAAFRGGAAGDVDYKGGAMQWYDVWEKWRSPQAKYLVIYSPKPRRA